MTAPYRTPAGGRIDRGTRHEFTFDGRTFTGHRGDTLASALLAHGVHKIATSVKLGRPRGISAAWAEDTGGLVQIEAPFPEPMLLASTVELHDGLAARGIPGQGRLADIADSARYDADACARRRARRRRRPRGADGGADRRARRRPGGVGRRAVRGRWFAARRHRQHRRRRRHRMGSGAASPSWRPTPRCDTCSAPPRSVTTTTASCLPSSGVPTTLATPPRPGCPVSGYGGSAPVTCSSRPALMSARSCSPTTTGPESCWRTARERSCTATGWWSDARRWCSPPTTAPTRRRSTSPTRACGSRRSSMPASGCPTRLRRECDRRSIPLRAGAVVAGTRGDERITHALVADFDGVNVGAAEAVSCDTLLVSGGWNPAVHLFSQARGVLRYDAALGGFVPGEHLAGRERRGRGQRRHGPGGLPARRPGRRAKRRWPSSVCRRLIRLRCPTSRSPRPRRVWCCGGCPAASRISSSTCSATPRSRTWRARSARACGRLNTSSATPPSAPRTTRARRPG